MKAVARDIKDLTDRMPQTWKIGARENDLLLRGRVSSKGATEIGLTERNRTGGEGDKGRRKR
jgi:hypothetical protein